MPPDGVIIVGAGPVGLVTPLADETAHPYNIHLGQDELCAIALEHLAALPSATVRWESPVTGLSQDVTGARVTTATTATPARCFCSTTSTAR